MSVHETATGDELFHLETDGAPWAALSPAGTEVAVGTGRAIAVYDIASRTRLAEWTVE